MLFTLISIAKSIQSLPKSRGIVSNVPFFLSEKSWDTAGNPPFSMILGQMCRFFGNYGFFFIKYSFIICILSITNTWIKDIQLSLWTLSFYWPMVGHIGKIWKLDNIPFLNALFHIFATIKAFRLLLFLDKKAIIYINSNKYPRPWYIVSP